MHGLKHQMEKRSMEHFAGLDVSVNETSICIVDETGRIVPEVKVASEPDALLEVLKSGVYHGIATHDERMIAATKDFAAREGILKDAFEFQMLYGVRRDLMLKLAGEGYRVRAYVPYGEYWYPYFMRRLAERPANVWFVLKNLWKG